ncbi:Regulatory protein RecX [Patescibacteria group bacterium]|nr:Regulatory protein RecX [Patescibacteria group bacterium]
MSATQGAEKSAPNPIKDACLRLLVRREHSQKELLNKLTAKGFNPKDIQAVIAELAEQGWQSDTRYAESYTRHRLKKGYGAIAISYELKQNGINGFDIDSVLFDVANDWLSLIKQVYEKKYGDDKKPSLSEKAKRTRFLLQRGFDNGLIQALFNSFKN